MLVGQRYTTDDYTGYIFPAAGFMDVGGRSVARKSPVTLGRVYFKGQPDEHTLAQQMLLLGSDYVEHGNEVNLQFEGNWTRESYKASFGRVRKLLPGMKLGWSSMSPNGDYLAWYTDARDSGADFVSIHIYGRTREQMRSTLDAILAAIAPLPAIISELNFGYEPGFSINRDVWARAHLRPFLLEDIRTRPRVLMTLYFADYWKIDTPGAAGTPVDSRGTAILDILAEAANLATDWNIGPGFQKVRDQLGWTPLENEVYHFGDNPVLKASMAVFDLGRATWSPSDNETVAIAKNGDVYSDGGNRPIVPDGSLVKIWPKDD